MAGCGLTPYGRCWDALVPIDIKIECGSIDDFHITLDNDTYYLHHGTTQLMCLNRKYFYELYDQQAFYDFAYGKVILSGFGFGLASLWLASKDAVKEIWVVEPHLETIRLFMRHNIMPSKVRIIHGSINDYKGEADCLFLDHFPDLHLDNLLPEVEVIGQNIKHDVGWYYTAELQYLRDMYRFNLDRVTQDSNVLNNYEFIEQWPKFQNLHKHFKLPAINAKQLKQYVDNFCPIRYQ